MPICPNEKKEREKKEKDERIKCIYVQRRKNKTTRNNGGSTYYITTQNKETKSQDECYAQKTITRMRKNFKRGRQDE